MDLLPLEQGYPDGWNVDSPPIGWTDLLEADDIPDWTIFTLTARS